MKSRLSSQQFAALSALRTRDASDPAIALLDSWAVIADVVTFYQERLANEGYIRTAKDRQSIIWLAELVGYTLAPGISASVYLSYTVDPTIVPAAQIPAGSLVQSLPAGQDALPQRFETESPVTAQDRWNNLAPRVQQPQVITSDTSEFYVNGVSANLKVNDPILITASDPILKRIATVDQQFDKKRTRVALQTDSTQAVQAPALKAQALAAKQDKNSILLSASVGLLSGLRAKRANAPPSPLDLKRNLSDAFATNSDTVPAMLETLFPAVQSQIYAGLKNTPVPPSSATIRALRVQAAPFGATAPQRVVLDNRGTVMRTEEWPLEGSITVRLSISLPPPNTDGARMGLLRTLEAGQANLNVGISTINTSSSNSLPVPNQGKSTTKPVGQWNVTLEGSASAMKLTFTPRTPPSVATLPDIELNIDSQSNVTVTVAGETSLTVPPGMDATQENAGVRTSVSFEGDFQMSHEIALPPDANTMVLDTVYDQLVPGTQVVILRPGRPNFFTTVDTNSKAAYSNYNISAKVTVLTLKDAWLDPKADVLLSAVRKAVILSQDEQLDLAQQPITDDVAGATIELGDLYSGLQPGRLLIVRGERTDLPDTSGVTKTEVAMVAGVRQDVKQINVPAAPAAGAAATTNGSGPVTMPLPGDTVHTFLELAQQLSSTYKVDTVSVLGNVVGATHGESRSEVLGSGDGSQTMQQFKLHYPNITHLSSPTGNGSQSTLQVTVNGMIWRRVDSLANAGPSDKVYVARRDADEYSTVQFGDGIHGMRLPTGLANVKATYRAGNGQDGNVDSDKITLLATRPLGVRSVTNPLASSAGADPESTEQGRTNAAAATANLDRLVAISDYADYARAFSGIGKADASYLSDGQRQLVYVTIAGSEGTIIDQNSDISANLYSAFQAIGDPHLAIQVGIAQAMLVVISAQVQLQDGYHWDDVAPAIRSEVNAAFRFDARNLGQWLFLSELVTVIQNVNGVAYVVISTLNKLSEEDASDKGKLAAALAAIVGGESLDVIKALRARRDASGVLQPAQIAFVSADLPDTFVLTEISQ
jgi:hypothetical protein